MQDSSISLKEHCRYGESLIKLYYENSCEQFKKRGRDDHPAFDEYLTALLSEEKEGIKRLLGDYVHALIATESLPMDNSYLGIKFNAINHYAVEYLIIPNFEALDIDSLNADFKENFFKYTDNIRKKMVENLFSRLYSDLPERQETI